MNYISYPPEEDLDTKMSNLQKGDFLICHGINGGKY